jgi:hypothetical protein
VISEEQRALREAAHVLLTLLRCVSMKRALSISDDDQLNFFRLYDACLMDVVVLSWCKILGAPREQLYWPKLFPKSADSQDVIRNQLEAASCGGFEALSNSVRNYRDTFVAHHDVALAKRARTHPKLGPLQLTGQIVYRAVYMALDSDSSSEGLPHPDQIMGERVQQIESAWRNIGDAARAATQAFSEPVFDAE